MKKKFVKIIISFSSVIALTACSMPENTPEDSESITETQESFVEITSITSNEVQENTLNITENTEYADCSAEITAETVETTEYSETSEYNYENTEIPVTTETVTETSESQYNSDSENEYSSYMTADDIISSMTLEEKIFQMFIVTPEELTGYDCVTESDETVKLAVENMPVGGVIYFSDNLISPDQTINMTENIQNYARESGNGVGMFIAVDEEGGSVARIADELGEINTGSAAYMENTDTAYQAGADIAEYISKYGFNLDFAPVADVNINPDNELGSRIFSDDPEIVSVMSGAMVSGLQNTGKVSATLKHFPGLGAEDGNTHYDSYTRIDRTYEELCAEEFQAFQGGIDADADFVMVGHQIMSCAGDDLPSDLSYTVVTEWLRNQLDFDGIIITDSHEMNTISSVYDSGESAVMAIEAGVDMILMPCDLELAVQSVSDAVYNGYISEERIDSSVYRILNTKQKLGLLNDIISDV